MCHGFTEAGNVTQAESVGSETGRDWRPEDTRNQKIWLPVIRSIIERERGNAVKAVDLLAPVAAIRTKANHRFFITVRAAILAQESVPRPPPSSRGLSVIADGQTRKCCSAGRNSVSRGPIAMQGTVRTAAKPTMIPHHLERRGPDTPTLVKPS